MRLEIFQLKTGWREEREEDLPLRFNHGTRWQIPLKDFSHRRILDERELDTEADNHGQHQADDEVLKDSQASHGSVGPVKDENDHDVQDGDCASCYQRYGRHKEV